MIQDPLDIKVKKATEKLAQLRAQMQARDQRLQAQKRASEKKEETRRLILAGAFLLGQLGQEVALATTLNGVLFSSWLTRPNDREVFGLSVLPPPSGGQGDSSL